MSNFEFSYKTLHNEPISSASAGFSKNDQGDALASKMDKLYSEIEKRDNIIRNLNNKVDYLQDRKCQLVNFQETIASLEDKIKIKENMNLEKTAQLTEQLRRVCNKLNSQFRN